MVMAISDDFQTKRELAENIIFFVKWFGSG